jgi:hypothetical protein
VTVVATYTVKLNVVADFTSGDFTKAATTVGALDRAMASAQTNAQKFTTMMRALALATGQARNHMTGLAETMRTAGFAQMAREAKAATSAVYHLNARLRETPARVRRGLAPGGGVPGNAPGFVGAGVGRGGIVPTIDVLGLARSAFSTVATPTRFAIEAQREAQLAQSMIASVMMTNADLTPETAQLRASGMFRDLARDAARGVGNLPAYLETYQRAYAPLESVGFDDQRIRRLTNAAVAAGFGYRGTEGARLASIDVQQALEGRLSERNTPIIVQALRAAGLPADAETFNAASMRKRAELLEVALSKAAKSATLFSQTYDAQRDAVVENVKELTRSMTGPLFESLMKGMETFNKSVDANRDTYNTTAEFLGETAAGYLNGFTDSLSRAAEALRRFGMVIPGFSPEAPEGIENPDRFARSRRVAQAYSEALLWEVSPWYVRGLLSLAPAADMLGLPAAPLATAPQTQIQPPWTPPMLLPELDKLADEVGKGRKVDVRIKLDARIDWGDDRQIATVFEDFADQVAGELTTALGGL